MSHKKVPAQNSLNGTSQRTQYRSFVVLLIWMINLKLLQVSQDCTSVITTSCPIRRSRSVLVVLEVDVCPFDELLDTELFSVSHNSGLASKYTAKPINIAAKMMLRIQNAILDLCLTFKNFLTVYYHTENSR